MEINVSVQYNGGLSPILCCRPDVITLGNPFDTEFRITVVVVFLFLFQKMKRKLSSPEEKNI